MNPDELRKFLWLLHAWNPAHKFAFVDGQLTAYGSQVVPHPNDPSWVEAI
jgi:hypothetical protein